MPTCINASNITSILLDSAHAIKSLCKHLDVKINELEFISYTTRIEKQDCIQDIRYIKSIPYDYTLSPIEFPDSIFPENKFQLNLNRESYLKEFMCPTHKIHEGLNQLELTVDNSIIPFWVFNSYDCYGVHPFGKKFFIVLKKDLEKFQHYIEELPEHINSEPKKPILPESYINDIYKNTISFLQNGSNFHQKYLDYGIPFKRGVLLAGEPGSGKTMTCKWLRQLCKKYNFEYSVVTMNEYNDAVRHGELSELFTLGNKGIIFFDDMDVLVRDRKISKSDDLYCFLSFIDGLDSPHGVVFVFTTNLIEDLDQAFLRPGRIDLFLTYRKPGTDLRRRFVEEVFHQDIKDQINDIEDIVMKTEGMSFAEIEEVKKLLAFDIIDGKNVDVEKTLELFNEHRTVFNEMKIKGFGEKIKDDNGGNDSMWSNFGVPQRR